MTKPKTWSGDDGWTDTLGAGRVEKSSLRMECLGSLDESSAALGLAKSFCTDTKIKSQIDKIQKALYRLMTETAASTESVEKFTGITSVDVLWVEQEVREIESSVKIPSEFILPGSTRFSAALDLARTTIRRAERRLVELSLHGDFQNTEGQKYVNRLSTLVFYLEIREIVSQKDPGKFITREI